MPLRSFGPDLPLTSEQLRALRVSRHSETEVDAVSSSLPRKGAVTPDGRGGKITRAACLALIEQTGIEHTGAPDFLRSDVLRMLDRAMSVLHDLVYGGEDFRAAEQLLEEWEPFSIQDLAEAISENRHAAAAERAHA